ncbi:MAG: HAMP domain-containing protein [Thioploca sp.]|nr:HAMP domain-containing protein [Thioploca sp.]
MKSFYPAIFYRLLKVKKVIFIQTSKLPLRTVLIIAFVTQILAVVGLTGWISFRHGQQTLDDLATQLRHEITARIQQHLQARMVMPHFANQLNIDAIRLGQLSLDHIRQLDHYFWTQIQRFKDVSYIAIATATGEYIGAQIRENGSVIVEILDSQSAGYLETWETDKQGNRTRISSRSAHHYDPRNRPWYRAAVKAGKPIWSDIYVYFTGLSTGISANYPLYDDQGRLVAVASADFTLLDIGKFLQELKVGQHGQTFIVERSGLLVATSSSEKPFRVNASTQKTEQLQAIESSDRLTEATSHYLLAHFANLTQIDKSYQLDFKVKNQRQFLQVMPFQDQWGLDWLIVVVVPEADFMERIDASTSATIWLFIVALTLAILIGIVIARWISEPLQHLNNAAKTLAQGEWHPIIELNRQDEVGQLAHSFNCMTQQLQEAFTHLEEKVTERTQALEAKNLELISLNEQLIKLNQEKNDFLSIVAHDLKNPLSAIQGAAWLIQSDYDELPKDQVVDFASMISETAHNMFELIKNLLEVNRIEAGKMKLSIRLVDILPILRRLVNDYQQRAKAKEIELIFEPTLIEYPALVDTNSLQQVLDNLISNAIKYSPPSKCITIRLKQNASQVGCEIQDEGPGLSEEDQQKLFGKFTRLSAQPTANEHSTGLGLFIVKKLVDNMQGQVRCNSELGKGATFIVEFPTTLH